MSSSRSLFCCCCGKGRKSASDDSGAYAALDINDGEGKTGGYQPPKSTPTRRTGRQNSSTSAVTSVASPPIPKLKDFKLLKCIGKGGFSKVLQVQHKDTHVVYALKVVSKAMLKGAKEEERLLAEAQILRRICHPFCITMQFSFQTQRELLYVFDFVPGGVLYHHLRQSRFFNEARARFYIAELILALEYLHGLGIIYRDLKLENCLIAHDGHLRLTDFGAAKDLGGDSKTTTFCGTPCYIAPEIIRGEQYDQSVDWWTTGVILYEMLVGKPPFTGNNRHSLYKNVLKAPIAMPERLSPAARDILMQLLQRNPMVRLGGHMIARGDSASVLKAHDFFHVPRSRSSDPAGAPSPVGSPVSSDDGIEIPVRGDAAVGKPMRNVLDGATTIIEESMDESNVFDDVPRPTPSGSVISTAMADAMAKDGRSPSPPLATATPTATTTAPGKQRKKRLESHEPCTWTWQELEKKMVEAPWKPKLVSANDTTYFDPILTSEPVSLADLPGARDARVRKDLVCIEDFDFAREQVG